MEIPNEGIGNTITIKLRNNVHVYNTLNNKKRKRKDYTVDVGGMKNYRV